MKLSAHKIIVLFIFCAGCQYNVLENSQPTDYQIELEKIRTDIVRSKQQLVVAGDSKTALRLVYHLYRYASLTGDFNDFKNTEIALQDTQDQYGASQQLSLFKATINFKLHRLTAAEADLIAVDKSGIKLATQVLRADMALQRGHYTIAGTAYSAISKENPSWDNLARLAYFKLHTGEPNKADQLYAQAQNKLTIKQMRHFAWLELQRGIIDGTLQRYEQALNHYLRAEQAYSGYWLISEHIAELYVLLERQGEAIARYQKVIAQTQNPEFISALAEIYQAENNPKADELYSQADALFDKQYKLYPEAAVGHFVQSLLKRKQIDPQIEDYAIRNHQWRPNNQTKYLLACVYVKLGNQAQALEMMQEILNSPWQSREIECLVESIN